MSTSPSPRSASVTVEVRYAETDQMGVVHHAVFPVWFELARTRLCRHTGFSYAQIEASGYLLLVTKLSIDYRKSARYPDEVVTTCRLERLASRGLRFGYEVHVHDELLARGTTEHVWFEVASGKPCRVPDRLAAPFASLLVA
ncbi:MAG: acyl-CoA thioesterase [bacterium]|nr:acyl-CoA thioesterase [bacterium]